VFAETLGLASVSVESSELDRIRQSYFYELDYSRDSCYEMQIRYGWGELMGVVREIDEDVAAAGKVTPESLVQVARDLFDPKHVNLVVAGSWQEKDRIAVMNELETYSSLW